MNDECPKCHDILPIDARGCACGWRKNVQGTRGTKDGEKKIDLYCPWDDYGQRCGIKGSLSDATNGDGPWYCPTHFWRLKGRAA